MATKSAVIRSDWARQAHNSAVQAGTLAVQRRADHPAQNYACRAADAASTALTVRTIDQAQRCAETAAWCVKRIGQMQP